LKLDAHVHTAFSAATSKRLLRKILKESYSSPQNVYRRAKANGMDLVTVTDHDTIDGALEIAHYPDVIIGCEVTATFADDGIPVHLGVLDINEAQHREIQKLRNDIRELMPYLKQEGIFTILNHPASQVSGPISPNHILALMPWIDAIETLNGSRLPSQNQTAATLAAAYGKPGIGGSDSHTLSRIGLTYLEADAGCRAEFIEAIRHGKVKVAGDECSCFTLSSDIVRLAASFYRDGIAGFFRNRDDGRGSWVVWGLLLGIPLTVLSLAGVVAYLMMEERFNRSLLFSLTPEPAGSEIEPAGGL
jgi:predicted metal-dependent phosphoesterase TrpH